MKEPKITDTETVEVRILNNNTIKVILSTSLHWGFTTLDVPNVDVSKIYKEELEVVLLYSIKNLVITNLVELLETVISYEQGAFTYKKKLLINNTKPRCNFIMLVNKDGKLLLRLRDADKSYLIDVGLTNSISPKLLQAINYCIFKDFIQNPAIKVIPIDDVIKYIKSSPFYNEIGAFDPADL